MFRLDRRLAWGLAATAVWIVATWWLQFVLDGSVLAEVVANIAEGASPAIAWVFCRRAARRTGQRSWTWIGWGCAAWTLGSVVWTIYVGLEHDQVPFPSLADAGYLLFFPPAIIGMMTMRGGGRGTAKDRLRSLLDALLVAASLTVILWWALLGAAHRGGNSFSTGLSVAYIVGDIVVLSLAVTAFRRSTGRRGDIGILVVALMFLTAGDALFSYQEANDSYAGAWFPDLGWIAGFTLIGYGAFVACRAPHESHSRPWIAAERSRTLVLFGPYLAAVFVTTWDLIDNGHISGTQAWTTIALASIAFARQVAAQAERAELTVRLEDRVRDLTASQARFFTVFEESIEALALLDEAGHVRLASRQLLTMLGLDGDRVVGRAALSFVHVNDRPSAAELHRRVLDGALTVSTTVRVPTRDKTRHIEMTLTNLLDNEAVGAVLLGCRDVSERVRQDQVLAASQSRFRAAFDNAPIGMLVIDADGTVNRVNGSFLRMLGVQDMSELAPRFLDLAHPNDREILERIAAPGVWTEDVARCDVRMTRHDGSIRWTSLSAVAITAHDEPPYVIAQIEDVTERREIARTLEHNARHDPLTGLANRTLFMQRLTDAIGVSADDKGVAVAFVDIDRFKLVNDSLGHDAGDSLLCTIADRLLRVSRERDVVARFGGDEFTLMLRDVPDNAVALSIAEHLEEALRQPVVLNDVETYITASVGIVVSKPLAAGVDAEEAAEHLLRDADTAMYRAKEAGRSRTELFDEHRDRTGSNRLEIANALHRAIEREEFRVFYQPVGDATTGEIQGFEALLRWEREPGEFVAPGEFIGVAEDTGLIVPIGEWVLRRACADAAGWHARAAREGLVRPTVSVNLSPRQFDGGPLVRTVERAIQDSGLPADALWLEITESALMRDTTSTITILRDLRRIGVHLSIDDFGTGYSSLSYLKRFPVEALKIDRSFTDGLGTEPEDTAIVTAVIGLAHALNLKAVAEGVETAAQLAHLRALGCDGAQGYFFGRPHPPGPLGEDLPGFGPRTARLVHTPLGENERDRP